MIPIFKLPTRETGYDERKKAANEILSGILRYLDSKYDIKTLYYPGSGWHKTPKETLGEDRTIHLSLEENREYIAGGYFKKLGRGIKVRGDYRQSPFRNNKFDVTLIWGIPTETAREAINDFRRVTKKDGLFVVGNQNLCSMLGFNVIYKSLDKQLERIPTPFEYLGIRVYQNK
ncbi:MAG: hypothetical protein ISS23_00260 [Nanoarchaeota archaeon]|nr:hypothetical protein [Nanoarchaeota archaeon]